MGCDSICYIYITRKCLKCSICTICEVTKQRLIIREPEFSILIMSVKSFKVCFVLLLLNIMLTMASEQYEGQITNRTCIPAEAQPSLNSSYCVPLYNFTKPFCKDNGIKLDDYGCLYSNSYQRSKNDHLNSLMTQSNLALLQYKNLIKRELPNWNMTECKNALVLFLCRVNFPSCDGTTSVYRARKMCKESCFELLKVCGVLYGVIKKYFGVEFATPVAESTLKCEIQPFRNAGDSPECWYYTGNTDLKRKVVPTDCLYLNGSSYHGNISVTISGTPCQSWTSQCPHRHTMNTTYPELNNAKNYCRNPQNSGKRPWCFTTDGNKRWEYCDIPKCISVDGNYGNWSLSSQCNVTCGQGFEIWRRTCNNPSPRYGGMNCSHLGTSTEYRQCTRKPCPVNGGYGNWTLSSPCSVSCGQGFEIWQRFCDNPQPRNGGLNCSVLGNSTSVRQCTRKPCPIDGNYSNWTRTSPCSVSCDKGFEIWTRKCNNPAPKYGGINCTKQGPDEVPRECNIAPCSVKSNVKIIGIGTGAGIAVILMVILVWGFICRRRRRKREEGFTPFAVLDFQPQLFLSAQPCENDNTKTSSRSRQGLTL